MKNITLKNCNVTPEQAAQLVPHWNNFYRRSPVTAETVMEQSINRAVDAAPQGSQLRRELFALRNQNS